MSEKRYVDMVVLQYKSGCIKPLLLVWENGVKYPIDRILNISKSSDGQMRSQGIRYTCLIQGHSREIFLEEDRWFVKMES